MRIQSIASGSSGNCIYVGSESTHILIDAGCSKKKITEGLQALGLTLQDIDAIFLTHEHSDHVAGLKTILRQTDIPVYLTHGTLEGLRKSANKDRPSTGSGRAVAELVEALSARQGDGSSVLLHNKTEEPSPCLAPCLATTEHTMHRVEADHRIVLKDLIIDPFRISHDALEPVCYRVRHGERAFVIATDMGCYDDYTVACLQGADVIMLEANHDIRMLQTGPYPYPLKQRILSDKGHLSNDASGSLLNKVLHDRLQTIMLGHLSECNNLPELAYETVRLGIEMDDSPYSAGDFRLMVADRKLPSPVVTL